MLSTKEISTLLAAKPNLLGAGKLAYLADRERQGTRGWTAKSEQLLRDLQAAHPGVTNAKTALTYQHPETAARGADLRRGGGPLSPVETAWLTRLPTDPSTVPHADATALAALAKSVSPIDHPMDARLVDSVWQPVKEHHDRNAADVALSNARALKPNPVPSSVLPAMAEAVKAENDQLSDGEAISRADALIAAAVRKRVDEHDAGMATAHDTIASIDAARAERTRVRG